MTEKTLPSFTAEELMSISLPLVYKVLYSIPMNITAFKPIRLNEKIIDFEYVFINEEGKKWVTHTDPVGKTLLTVDRDTKLFETMSRVTETGQTCRIARSFTFNNKEQLFHVKIEKLNDVVLLFHEKQDDSVLPADEELYRSLLENTPDVITRWNRNLELIYANPAFEVKTGMSNISLLGKTPGEIELPEGIAIPFMEKLQQVFSTGDAAIHYNIYPAPAGDVYFFSRIVPEKNAAGNVETVLAIARDVTELKKAELELKEKNEQIEQIRYILEKKNNSLGNFKRITDTSHDAICSMDMNGRVNYWNSAAESIYGYRSSEATGKKIDDLVAIHNQKTDLVMAMTQVYEHGRSVKDMITQKRKKDGSMIDVLINIFPLKDEGGQVTGSCMITKDITDLRKAREKMREDAHFIGQIMDTTPDIIFIMDLNTYHVIYSNRSVAADLGYTKEQIAVMKNPILDIMHKDDIPAMIAHLKKMKTFTTDDKVIEIQYRMKNPTGGYSWFCDRDTVFKRDSRKIPVEKIGITQNITLRKKEEEKQQTSLNIIRQAEEIVAMGSWEYDIHTGDFKWSEGMYRLFNISPDEKIAPEIYLDYSKPEEKEKVSSIVKNIKNTFGSFEETITLYPPEQESKIVKIKAIVIKDKSNEPLKMIGVDLDITPQVKASESINDLNKILVSKNRDLETLNTELRTFNKITSRDYTENLHMLYTNFEYIVTKEARHLSDTAKANIRRAQAAIQKMKLLTEDINAYLQLYDVGIHISLTDPYAIIKEVIFQMKNKIEQAGIKVDLHELAPLHADPALLSQLMSNLLDNAIKFRNTAAPSVVKIKYSIVRELNSIPNALKDTSYYVISVSDNGIGFEQTDTERIFDLFVKLHDKSRYRGAGIGLAICKKIMSMHDGFISAEGIPANGATFNCYFPLKSS